MASMRASLVFLCLVALTCAPHAVLGTPSRKTDPQASPHTPINKRTAQEVIDKLGLIPNEEKGYYIQTFEDPFVITSLNRSASTAIYYLLEGAAGDSVWHRVDAAEVWHYYAGAPLVLSLSYDDGQPLRRRMLGPDVFDADQAPQVAIQRGEWQSARSLGEWTLVGTTVAPGFIPTGVELAEPGWTPNAS
ncbi:hypothetical protein KVR01_013178 [Diaporthe batatas]|uniref:uncharacterized protein n=1 Tax=Diaporthe batatas TaxID=748121 RepID=UPI001D040D40|nr:uncharacterized protein KVR01_013178 [Diaporthe batatas]KAG8156956.1 hypothetical protein KVR01_013178 [Diaporthe batatas]